VQEIFDLSIMSLIFNQLEGIRGIPNISDHVVATEGLPLIHKDPFDMNCYSRAMPRGYACGRLEARARFQTIAALATPKFRPAEKALQNGYAG